MSESSPPTAAEVVAVCRAGASEAAAAIRRALGSSVAVHVGAAESFQSNALPEDLAGPGLVIVFTVGPTGALLALPASTGLLPAWCEDPDPTGQSKLATLAQELGAILLPESLAAGDARAGRVKNLAGALARGGVGEGASIVPLQLSVGAQPRGTASLIWPLPRPELVLGIAVAKAHSPGPVPAGPRARPQPKLPATSPPRLPPYTRSLLSIKVPVVVTLAEKRQPLAKIVEMSPGAIIQFDKSCEEMLELSVGNHAIANGEAVKVGDKFGLRITSMVLPEERFHPVKAGPKNKSGV